MSDTTEFARAIAEKELRGRKAAGVPDGWVKRVRADGMTVWEPTTPQPAAQTACSGCGMEDEPIRGGHLEDGRYVAGLCSYCKALRDEQGKPRKIAVNRAHPVPVITRRERAVGVTAITLIAVGTVGLVLGAMSAALAVVILALAVLAFGAGMACGLIFAADRSTPA
jgi:hypothetical protein